MLKFRCSNGCCPFNIIGLMRRGEVAVLGLCPSLKFHLEQEVLESHELLGDAAVGVHGPGHPLKWGVVGHQHKLTTQVALGQLLHPPLNGKGFLFGGGELSTGALVSPT